MMYNLPQLGWSAYFQQQLSLDEYEHNTPARVVVHERSIIELLTVEGQIKLSITHSMPALIVGDWVLLDHEHHFYRMLDRYSLFMRKAAGTKVDTQLIAANINTVFILSSLNHDFNLNRIERYLALAHEAGVGPVVVLSKADCVDQPEEFLQQVQGLDPILNVLTINCLDPASIDQLSPWCHEGSTIVLLGSSGVGKSTLTNTLLGNQVQQTQSIREDDGKGRHTTTGRSLHSMPTGGLLLDTPGMRELQLASSEQGLEETFREISELARQCKFNDCSHQNEPGCRVRAAIKSGELQQRRLDSFQKLMKEQAFNEASLVEKRARDKSLGQLYRSAITTKAKLLKDL